jgi:hypothetical protein
MDAFDTGVRLETKRSRNSMPPALPEMDNDPKRVAHEPEKLADEKNCCHPYPIVFFADSKKWRQECPKR